MKCAWAEFLQLVPTWMRSQVDSYGKSSLQELRMRLGQAPEMISPNNHIRLLGKVTYQDIQYTINVASNYSPWTASTMANGYLTGPGGHRIGICGVAVIKNDKMEGFKTATSLCIRVARDFPGIAKSIEPDGSVLIIGNPGSGKTTLLRDLIRKRSEEKLGSITVIDERGEIFPQTTGQAYFETGCRTDIISGCSKRHGITMALRTMGPSCIAVDEITAIEDTRALMQATWCGVDLYATAHAGSKTELYARPIYRPIVTNNVFKTLLVLRTDQSWSLERMDS